MVHTRVYMGLSGEKVSFVSSIHDYMYLLHVERDPQSVEADQLVVAVTSTAAAAFENLLRHPLR